MKKTYYFLAGLPRSGSTVLASILNQNPEVYVTPTSPLLDIIIANQNEFHKSPSILANPNVEQLTNISRAIIDSAWIHRPEPIIIDKNRGWGGSNIEAMETLLGTNIKIVNTVRDLPSIMASWLTVIKKNPNSYIDDVIQKKGFEPNDDNYMAEMWFHMVKDCMDTLQYTKKNASNRSIFIDYDDLVNDPKGQIKRIETFLELPSYDYDFTNIQNDTRDDDLIAWGFEGMHTVRPKLEKVSRHPKEVLGEELYNRFLEIEREYK